MTELKRSLGTVRKLSEGEDRKIIFTASTDTKDRHGTVLNQKNWDLENFNRNGIIGYNHEVYGGFGSSDPDDIIGTGRAFVEDGELLVEVDFEPADINEKADKIFKKVSHGSLKAVSVGFSPTGEGEYGKGTEARGAENETYYFAGQELIELSIVNIPSNPDAVKRSLTENEFEVLKNSLTDEQKEVLKKELGLSQNEFDERVKEEVDLVNRDLLSLQKLRLELKTKKKRNG